VLHPAYHQLHQALTSKDSSKHHKVLQDRVYAYVGLFQDGKVKPAKTTFFSGKSKTDELLQEFVEICEIWDDKERSRRYWKLRGDILVHVLVDKGVQS